MSDDSCVASDRVHVLMIPKEPSISTNIFSEFSWRQSRRHEETTVMLQRCPEAVFVYWYPE